MCEQVCVYAALCVCVCVWEVVGQLQPHIAVVVWYQSHVFCIPLSCSQHAPLFCMRWFASSLQELSAQSRWMTESLEEERIFVLLPAPYCFSQHSHQPYRQKDLSRSLNILWTTLAVHTVLTVKKFKSTLIALGLKAWVQSCQNTN